MTCQFGRVVVLIFLSLASRYLPTFFFKVVKFDPKLTSLCSLLIYGQTLGEEKLAAWDQLSRWVGSGAVGSLTDLR